MEAEGHTPPSGEERAIKAVALAQTQLDAVTNAATEERKDYSDKDREDMAQSNTARRKERHRKVPLAPEVRFFAPTGLEVRSASDTDEIIITGAPIIYGAAYRVVDMFGEFEERIHAGSVAELLTRGVDCRFLLNHEGMAMARTTSGTLRLFDSDDQLGFEARLDARQQIANDFAIAVQRGDMTQMSVGMIVGRDDWGHDGQTETRDIYALSDLLDISGVTYACSPTTHMAVSQRMAMAMPLESRARLRKMEVELRAGKVLSADSQSKLVTALTALHDLANAGGVDPADIGPDDDEANAVEADGSEGGSNAESDAGVVYPNGTGQRKAPDTADERRALSLSFGDQQTAVYQALQADLSDDADDYCDIWICDIGDGWVVFEAYTQSVGLFKASYELADDGTVTLGDDLQKVTPSTVWVPATRSVDDEEPPRMKASTLRLRVEAGRQPLTEGSSIT